GDTQKASSPCARALTCPATALSQSLLASMRRAAAILNLMSLVSTNPSPWARRRPDSSKNTTIEKSAVKGVVVAKLEIVRGAEAEVSAEYPARGHKVEGGVRA